MAASPVRSMEGSLDNYPTFTASQIRYIIYLYRLSHSENGVKNVELAEALGLSKPSVHTMLKTVAARGVISHEWFGRAYFTEEGHILARKYTVCYAILEQTITALCGAETACENAVCAQLAWMPQDKIDALYNRKDS